MNKLVNDFPLKIRRKRVERETRDNSKWTAGDQRKECCSVKRPVLVNTTLCSFSGWFMYGSYVQTMLLLPAKKRAIAAAICIRGFWRERVIFGCGENRVKRILRFISSIRESHESVCSNLPFTDQYTLRNL